MPLRLYNTLTRRIEAFIPRDPAHITFYSCGPTVYDDAHIGNFRSFLAADLLRRFLESPLCRLARDPADTTGAPGPRRVTHVMNITDVGHMTDDAGEGGEDRMAVAGRRITEAKKSGALPADTDINPADPYAIAAFYADRFLADARALGLKVALDAASDPSLMPRATNSIPGMIDVISRLLDRAFAYVVGEPGSRVVYFDVRRFTPYGRLSGNTLDALKEGQGGRVSAANQAGKRHPADFLLWKEDPRHIMKWPSPWGEGYPGWHIECSAMSFARLVRPGAELFPDGEPLIDLHSGGEDNIFPHHECELAQSCAAFNEDPASGSFARLWFHPRFLLVDGDKMSKSKGNFFTARQLMDQGHEPAAIRLELIKTHYRSNANFTTQGLKDAAKRVHRWRAFARRCYQRFEGAPPDPLAAPRTLDHASAHLVQDFPHALFDDLNIAKAIASIEVWMSAVEQSWQHDQELEPEVFALFGRTPQPTTPSNGPDALKFLEPHEAMPYIDGQPDRDEKNHWAILSLIDHVLGVLSLERPRAAEHDAIIFLPGVTPTDEIIQLANDRRDARASKDFARADAIRDRLAALGLTIKDAPGGKVEIGRGEHVARD